MSVARRFLATFSFLLLECIFATPTNACILGSCFSTEVRPSFMVLVTHSAKPLAGVSVEVSGNDRQVSFTTGAEGTVAISSLQPGEYQIDVRFLGISAAHECVKVSASPTRKAQRKFSYEWGDKAPATQRIAGTLSQPGKVITVSKNLIEAEVVPVVGTKVNLQDPINGTVYTTSTDKNGYFALDGVPEGIYVLHLEGGGGDGDAYGYTDELIELSSHAKNKFLEFIRGGDCGGTHMELKAPPPRSLG